jgi:hypothetical protein
MSPKYRIETSGGSGTSIIVSVYPLTGLILNFRYNGDYRKYIDNFAVGVWRIKKKAFGPFFSTNMYSIHGLTSFLNR